MSKLKNLIRHSDFEAIRKAICSGASLEKRDRAGNTPAHIAALVGNEKIVELLLDAGAFPGANNSLGKKPHELGVNNCTGPQILKAQLESNLKSNRSSSMYRKI